MQKYLVMLGGVALFCACALKAQPPSTAPSTQQKSMPVVVPITVLTPDGENVSNLTQPDFRLFENDQEQKISGFQAVDAPFNVVLLLDTSSNAGFKTELIQRAAAEFVERLRPQNPVMVVSFNKEVSLNAEFTTDRDQLRRAIDGIRGGGETRLYDAVEAVLAKHLKPIEGRKAIVLFSAGVDTASQTATARSTLELAEESGALIYTIRFQTEGAEENPTPAQPGGQATNTGSQSSNAAATGAKAGSSGAQYLRDLTEHTGARVYRAESTEHLSKALAMIAVELRQQYALSYSPTNAARDGSYRRLRILVDRPGLTVYARPGYRAAK